MWEENVEVCKRALDLINRLGPTAGVEAALEYVDPEGVMESAIVSGAEGNTYRGHDGFRAWAAVSEEAFEELRSTPKEFRELLAGFPQGDTDGRYGVAVVLDDAGESFLTIMERDFEAAHEHAPGDSIVIRARGVDIYFDRMIG